MTDTIRRIGLFIIAAQTFIHFAAGQQYERYMKIIAGVIVLLMFVQPFTRSELNFADRWQNEMELLTEQIERQNGASPERMPDTDYGAGERILRQLEEEVKNRLNQLVSSEGYYITDVLIDWTGNMGQDPENSQDMGIDQIRIYMRRQEQSGENPSILIEEIQVEMQSVPRDQEKEDGFHDTKQGTEDVQKIGENDMAQDMECRMQEYRRRFAQMLEIDEERVEVKYVGGR